MGHLFDGALVDWLDGALVRCVASSRVRWLMGLWVRCFVGSPPCWFTASFFFCVGSFGLFLCICSLFDGSSVRGFVGSTV